MQKQSNYLASYRVLDGVDANDKKEVTKEEHNKQIHGDGEKGVGLSQATIAECYDYHSENLSANGKACTYYNNSST